MRFVGWLAFVIFPWLTIVTSGNINVVGSKFLLVWYFNLQICVLVSCQKTLNFVCSKGQRNIKNIISALSKYQYIDLVVIRSTILYEYIKTTNSFTFSVFSSFQIFLHKRMFSEAFYWRVYRCIFICWMLFFFAKSFKNLLTTFRYGFNFFF